MGKRENVFLKKDREANVVESYKRDEGKSRGRLLHPKLRRGEKRPKATELVRKTSQG